MVISGQNYSGDTLPSRHHPWPQRVFRQSLSLLRRKERTDMKSPKAWKMEYMKSTAKEDYDTLAVL